MDNAIPSLLIGALLLIASAFLARGGLHSYDQLATSVKAMEDRLAEQTRTRLAITDVSVSGGGATVSVTLRNEGQTRIASFDRLDVILTYFVSPATQLNVWLPYSEAAAANTWTLASIDGDEYGPGILDPGETAHLDIELTPSVEPGKTNLIVVGGELGSSISAPFGS